MNNSIFLNYNKILSYMFTLAFIIGERGNGKTYGFKKWAINDYIKNKSQFIYLRRYKSELKDCSKFFDDISKNYPNYEFKVNGRTFLIKKSTEQNWGIMGWAVELSTALIKKSVSYSNVNKICFDEFLILKSHIRYLYDEVIMFLEFYETVARLRNDVRCVFLGNKISEINPYFLFFNIKLKNVEYDFIKDRNILICQTNCEEYKNVKRETKFAYLVKGTKYENYLIGDTFLSDNYSRISSLSPNASVKLVLKFNNELVGVWVDYINQNFYFSEKTGNCLIKFAVIKEDIDNEFNYLGRSGWGVDLLRRVFKSNSYYYDNIQTKNIVFDIMKKIGV